MSSFGSSVINKSGKKIAPKAPTQRSRPTAATSTTISDPPTSRSVTIAPESAPSLSQTVQPATDALEKSATVAPAEQPLSSAQAGTTNSQIGLSSDINADTTRIELEEPSRKRKRVEFAETRHQGGPISHLSEASQLQPEFTGHEAPGRVISANHEVGENNNATETEQEQQHPANHQPSSPTAAIPLESVSSPAHPPTKDLGVGTSKSRKPATKRVSRTTNAVPTSAAEAATQHLSTHEGTGDEEATTGAAPEDVVGANLTASSNDSLQQIVPVANMTTNVVHESAAAAHHDNGNSETGEGPKKKGRTRKASAENRTTSKAPRKRKKKVDVETGGNEDAAATEQPVKKRRRKREVTPEDAEDIEIDPETLTMFELARASKRSSKGGRTSKLERAMESINWEEVAQKRKEKEAEDRAAGLKNAERGVNEKLNQAGDDAQRGPRLKLVNGQMVIDNSSLYVNRHGEAPEGEGLDELEEDDLTARINSHSWIFDNKKDPEERYRSTHKSDPWSLEDTDKFYDALSMWGTDFQIMAAMFPGKTRRHIKLKFVREERANPGRVNSALVHDVVPMNLETFCAATGQDEDFYKDPDALNEELRIEEEQQREEIQKQKEDVAEAQRQKQEAAAAKLGKKRTRKNKSSGSGGAGGEEVEVDLSALGEIPT